MLCFVMGLTGGQIHPALAACVIDGLGYLARNVRARYEIT